MRRRRCTCPASIDSIPPAGGIDQALSGCQVLVRFCQVSGHGFVPVKTGAESFGESLAEAATVNVTVPFTGAPAVPSSVIGGGMVTSVAVICAAVTLIRP